MSERTFTTQPAKRESVPLLVGLMGPSGCGKTMSALRLAKGMKRITGGEVFCIDTESRRALHYADDFEFEHLQFDAPFSPLDYLAAIAHCVEKGAKTIIVDSMSHEHEGPGGVLEWHDEEMARLSKLWGVKIGKAQIPAWSEPKKARRRLLNSILQLGVSAIFCFRAKEKLKIVTGKDPLPLGWMPIAGEEFLYEMTVNCLLYPASGGVPTWQSDEVGEKAMMKLPRQFREIFAQSQPLSEEIGQQLAEWAAGDSSGQADAPDEEEFIAVTEKILGAEDSDALKAIAADNKSRPWTTQQRAEIKQAIHTRSEELEAT